MDRNYLKERRRQDERHPGGVRFQPEEAPAGSSLAGFKELERLKKAATTVQLGRFGDRVQIADLGPGMRLQVNCPEGEISNFSGNDYLDIFHMEQPVPHEFVPNTKSLPNDKWPPGIDPGGIVFGVRLWLQ